MADGGTSASLSVSGGRLAKSRGIAVAASDSYLESQMKAKCDATCECRDLGGATEGNDPGLSSCVGAT